MITSPGAAPGHRKSGGPIREASHEGEDQDADVLCITVCTSFANSDCKVSCYNIYTMIVQLFICFAIMGGSSRPKMGVSY